MNYNVLSNKKLVTMAPITEFLNESLFSKGVRMIAHNLERMDARDYVISMCWNQEFLEYSKFQQAVLGGDVPQKGTKWKPRNLQYNLFDLSTTDERKIY